MAFLAKFRKVDLARFAEEMGLEITSEDRVIDICKKIKNSLDYEEEFAKGQLDVIVHERENEIAEAEIVKKEREAELAKKERETERAYELEKLRITSAAETASLNSTRSEGSRNRREIKHLMQKFDSQNTEISLYLTLFERQARAAGIEEEEWVSQLISLLPLDLAQIIIKESEEQMREYTNVKKVLLDRFQMRPETFRIKFTQHQRKQGALWKDLVFELQNYFDSWIEGLHVKDFKGLKELMISDQLKRRVPNERIKDHFLDEWGELIDPLVLAGKLDQYESVRGHRKVNPVRMAERKTLDRARPTSPRKEQPAENAEKTEHQFGKISAPKGNWRNEKFERTQPACYICHSTSHLRPNCPQLNKSKELVNRVGLSEQTQDLFTPYLSKALVNNDEMDILRDTGPSIDIVSRNHVRPEHFTEVVYVKQPLDSEFRCLPLAKVELQSPEFGCVVTKAAVIDAQLDTGWYFLSNKTHELILEAKRKPNLNAVVTRSQTRKIKPPKSGEKEKKAVSPEEPAAVVEGDATPLSLPPAVREDGRLIGVHKGALQSAQKGFSTLQACFSQAGRGNSDFRVKEGTLFRESKDHYGNISLQVVIPQVYRDKILALCHEGTSSHLGVRKTKDRLLKHYFWPNCIKEIEGYVRSCDPCQRMGKGNEKVKAPLKLVPIITEVFSKMNIDAVGPLPTSSKGNSYLLTVICMSSRYPDAIPVADISSVSVTDALLEIFSKMGFPRQIQSDLGSSFTSFLTTGFFDRFGIKVTHSSVHHPQTNPVERFHRTINRMLKVLCLESGQDWEKNLPATLLALRTITHDSTGFSPEELVHEKKNYELQKCYYTSIGSDPKRKNRLLRNTYLI
ncbi:Retrovirus-related Pol polyprotein from transposon 412 [Araneus ventricosus]|uniref:RNA-directed DNA polymerase n=1 Tax=Araneus ventricosus TaxID=182803 RepID=A0A4Y2G6L5_ARAVE|nr:Retrovirus-related Pol polyprotein from transposon 412 [Araneus ventricosus]